MKKFTKDDLIELAKKRGQKYLALDSLKAICSYSNKPNKSEMGYVPYLTGHTVLIDEELIIPWYENWEDSLVEIYPAEKQEPKVGNFCKFWDYDEKNCVYGILADKSAGQAYSANNSSHWFNYCEKCTDDLPGYVKEEEYKKVCEQLKRLACSIPSSPDKENGQSEWQPTVTLMKTVFLKGNCNGRID